MADGKKLHEFHVDARSASAQSQGVAIAAHIC